MFRDTIAIIKKGISKGVEWHKFQLCSTFQWGVMNAKRDLIKMPYCSPWFPARNGKSRFRSNSMSSEVYLKGSIRNDTNFSFIHLPMRSYECGKTTVDYNIKVIKNIS